MNEYIVKEDRTKLVCYTMLNLILTVILMMISIYFYSVRVYIIAFFGITGIWFSVKAMSKYASRWFKKTPVCELRSNEVIIHSLPEKNSVMNPAPFGKKFEAFGWNVIAIDGHDMDAIQSAYAKAKECKGKPTMIVAKTIKGKGVSYMENNYGWHGVAPSDEELATALKDLGE